jgi:hypothetical protein
MQQSKAYVIKNNARNLKATMAARKAEYALYRYGSGAVTTPFIPKPVTKIDWRGRVYR